MKNFEQPEVSPEDESSREEREKSPNASWEDVSTAWSDAQERLLKKGDEESKRIRDFVVSERDTEKLQEYLDDNEGSLSPEAQYSLRMSIEMRKFVNAEYKKTQE